MTQISIKTRDVPKQMRAQSISLKVAFGLFFLGSCCVYICVCKDLEIERKEDENVDI